MSLNQKSVLVVDDDTDVCEAIVDILSMEGIKTVTAFDGVQAIQKYNRQDFDLVITDINMPKLNGVELIQTVTNSDKTNKKKTPPIIIISGDLSAFKNHLEKLDGVEILPKPFEREKLSRLAISLLTGQRKQYTFKAPDELLLLTEKIMAKIANSLLGKEVNHQLKPQKNTDTLVFDELNVIQMYYSYDQKIGKIIIALEDHFVTTLQKALKKEGRSEDTILLDFTNILTSVFAKSIEKRFLNMKIVDSILTKNHCNFLSDNNMYVTDTGYYKIYNISLIKE